MSSDHSGSVSSLENDQLVRLVRGHNMEARMEHQTARRYKSIYGFTTCIGATLVVLVITWCSHFRGGFAWSSSIQLQFNWHPVLMVISLVFLYSQSMLIYRTRRNAAKRSLKLTHAALHFGAFTLAVIGLKAVFDFHNYSSPPKANLYTLHSWIGLVTIILFASQFLAGFLTFLYPGLSSEVRKTAMPVHTAIGTATFVLAIASSLMGLLEKAIWTLGADYATLSSESLMINFIGVFLALFGVLTLYLVNEVSYKRINLPEEELTLAGHAN